MPIEISTLPGGGGFIVSAAAYVGLSILAGQEMAQRHIDKLDWQAICEQSVQADIDSRRTQKTLVPEVRCSETFGWLGPDAIKVCNHLGDFDLNTLARKQEETLHKQREALEAKRFERLAAKAGSQCGCAEDVFRAEHMIPLGLYAGSARLVTPAAVENLEQSLQTALATPQCQALGRSGA